MMRSTQGSLTSAWPIRNGHSHTSKAQSRVYSANIRCGWGTTAHTSKDWRNIFVNEISRNIQSMVSTIATGGEILFLLTVDSSNLELYTVALFCTW